MFPPQSRHLQWYRKQTLILRSPPRLGQHFYPSYPSPSSRFGTLFLCSVLFCPVLRWMCVTRRIWSLGFSFSFFFLLLLLLVSDEMGGVGMGSSMSTSILWCRRIYKCNTGTQAVFEHWYIDIRERMRRCSQLPYHCAARHSYSSQNTYTARARKLI